MSDESKTMQQHIGDLKNRAEKYRLNKSIKLAALKRIDQSSLSLEDKISVNKKIIEIEWELDIKPLEVY